MGAVTKLSGPETNDYDITETFTVLCCGNIEVNSNKYYVIELQKNKVNGNYRLYTEYGRMGVSHVYEMRGPYISLSDAKHEYDRIIKAKQRGKTGGTSKYEIVNVITPTVGSNNIRGRTSAIKVDNTKEIVAQAKNRFEPDVLRLLNQFADENIHKLTTSASLTFTSRGIETALGPVTESHVQRARQELQSIQSIVRAGGGSITRPTKEFQLANNRYLSLIPHTFGRKITESDWIATDAKLIEEFDLLDQLEAAVKLGLKSDTTAPQKFGGLDVEIIPIEAKPFIKLVNDTKVHSHLRRWEVKNAYEIKIPKERSRFDIAEKKYGNHMDFFHGSTNCNYLSILLNGLIIPNHGDGISIAGRMFGNGIYGASSSTKSLNYSIGSWTHSRNKYPNAFLLRVKFAMGKIYEPHGKFLGYSRQSFKLPAGYDSTAVYPRNTDLQNEEYIVYSLEQCTITHLLELVEK